MFSTSTVRWTIRAGLVRSRGHNLRCRIKDSQQFKDRLQPAESASEAVTGQVSKTLGGLKVKLEVNDCVGDLSVEAVEELKLDMILGMEFWQIGDIETKFSYCHWSASQGQWKLFDRENGSSVYRG